MQLQKTIYQTLKSRALELEEEHSPELVDYRSSQENFSKSDFEISSEDKLFQKIEKSHIVYFGDFHTFDQNSRNVSRILRSLISKNQKVNLGVELVSIKDQNQIDAFLGGFITELEFLEAIRYHESWRFPWKHYKELFEFAKKHKLNVYALNSKGGLPKRDTTAAQKITEILHDQKDAKLLILFGEYHIVNDKLPQKVLDLNNETIHTIVHQNLDDVFWKLPGDNLDVSSIVQFSEFEFSIQSSAPWLKYESMLYWYENILEDPDFDIHEILIQSNAQKFSDNIHDLFFYLSNLIVDYIHQSQFTKAQVENFNLYDYTNLELINDKITEIKNEEVQNFYIKLLQHGKSFQLPGTNIFYCSNYSVNRLSFLSGIHVFNLKANNSTIPFDDKALFFISFFQENLVGFYSSKIINPYRKTDLYLDLKNKSQTSNYSVDFLKSYHLAISILDSHYSKSSQSNNFDEYEYIHLYFAARHLGFLFAETLFDLRTANATTKSVEPLLLEVFRERISLERFFELTHEIDQFQNIRKTKKRFF
ncbi:MAG: ChaN family lipoprotein [Bacteriovoracaceae bacterium]